MKHLVTSQQWEKYEEFNEFASREILPFASEWEKNELIPQEILKKCADAHYFGSMIPQEYGGNALDCVTFGLFSEAIARSSTSFSGLFNVHNMVMQSILKWGTAEQKQRWLPLLAKGELLGAFALTEPQAGSDIQGITTSMTLEEDHVMIQGTKKWITFGNLADVLIVFGKESQSGKPTACLVERDTPGLTITPIAGMLGFKAGYLARLEFDHVIVPKENILAKPGVAFSHIAPYALDYGRVSVAFTALGILKGCLEYCSKYVLDRKAFGYKLIEQSTIKEKITEMGVDFEAACHLCFDAVRAKEAKDLNTAEKVMIAKYFTTKAANVHANEAVQILGAKGCNDELPITRYYRDSKTLEIVEGSNQILEMLLGKSFARKFKQSGSLVRIGEK